jgi:hypothetical protein
LRLGELNIIVMLDNDFGRFSVAIGLPDESVTENRVPDDTVTPP